MSLISWAVLIILALIAIIAILAIALYFTFWSNAGANPGFGVFLAAVAALILAAIYPAHSSSEVVPAVIIAGAILIAVVGLIMNLLLPNFDNKDAVLAARPILLLTIASSLAVAVYSIAKVIIA